MTDTFTFKSRPPQEVTSYFDEKGLRPAFDWQDTWGDEHVSAFTVAKATQADVLATIRDDVSRAIREGVPFEQFRKDLTPRLQQLGWWGKKDVVDPLTGETVTAQLGSPRRLKTIYWANTRSARAAGQWSRAQRTKRALPYFLYGLGNSANHRQEHVAQAGVLLPVDHPHWDRWFPPNGWGCNCWLRQISKMEAEGLGGESEEPDIPELAYVNERTGEETRVPLGIDPGWANNPGKTRSGVLRRDLGQSLGGLTNDVRRGVVSASPLKDFAEAAASGALRPQANIPFAAIDDELGAAIGTKARTVFLSADTIAAHQATSGMTAERYAVLAQQMIDDGEIWRDRKGRLSVFSQVDGVFYLAGIKITKFDEAFFTTMHRFRSRKIDSLRKTGERVR